MSSVLPLRAMAIAQQLFWPSAIACPEFPQGIVEPVNEASEQGLSREGRGGLLQQVGLGTNSRAQQPL